MKRTLYSLLFLSVAGQAAADGMLDPSFGEGGLVRTSFSPGSNDVAVSVGLLPDGRIVAAGQSATGEGQQSMAVARYLPDGGLDPTFDGDGRLVLTPPGRSTSASATAVLVQPDGKVVLAGVAGPSDFALVRLAPDGSVDPAFGTNGWVRTPVPGATNVLAFDARLLPDGRILSVGLASFGALRYSVVVQHLPTGALDTAFGEGGIAFLPITSDFWAVSVDRMPDGRIVVGLIAASQLDFAVMRLLPDGTPDRTFDGDGLALATFPGSQTTAEARANDDGTVLVVGLAGGPPSNSDIALTRFLPSGAVDVSFGSGGLAQVITSTEAGPGALLTLPNGNILVAGFSSLSAAGDFVLVRLLPSGALDTSFGTVGILTTDFGGADRATAVLLAGPERLLVAGVARSTGPLELDAFALARYIATTPVELDGFSVE